MLKSQELKVTFILKNSGRCLNESGLKNGVSLS